MPELPDNDTRQKILDHAEDLFARKGYTAVTLRDIAGAVNMKHASLYYYAPGGKKQLFVEVMERHLRRHQVGLTDAIQNGGDDFRQQLYGVAAWLVNQPPMYLNRMVESDLTELGSREAEYLSDLAYDAMRLPLVAALDKAVVAGLIHIPDLDMAALALVSLVQSVHHIPGEYGANWREIVGKQLVDMLLDGWLKR